MSVQPESHHSDQDRRVPSRDEFVADHVTQRVREHQRAMWGGMFVVGDGSLHVEDEQGDVTPEMRQRILAVVPDPTPAHRRDRRWRSPWRRR